MKSEGNATGALCVKFPWPSMKWEPFGVIINVIKKPISPFFQENISQEMVFLRDEVGYITELQVE